jgi:hypothetical protein
MCDIIIIKTDMFVCVALLQEDILFDEAPLKCFEVVRKLGEKIDANFQDEKFLLLTEKKVSSE